MRLAPSETNILRVSPVKIIVAQQLKMHRCATKTSQDTRKPEKQSTFRFQTMEKNGPSNNYRIIILRVSNLIIRWLLYVVVIQPKECQTVYVQYIKYMYNTLSQVMQLVEHNTKIRESVHCISIILYEIQNITNQI